MRTWAAAAGGVAALSPQPRLAAHGRGVGNRMIWARSLTTTCVSLLQRCHQGRKEAAQARVHVAGVSLPVLRRRQGGVRRLVMPRRNSWQ